MLVIRHENLLYIGGALPDGAVAYDNRIQQKYIMGNTEFYLPNPYTCDKEYVFSQLIKDNPELKDHYWELMRKNQLNDVMLSNTQEFIDGVLVGFSHMSKVKRNGDTETMKSMPVKIEEHSTMKMGVISYNDYASEYLSMAQFILNESTNTLTNKNIKSEDKENLKKVDEVAGKLLSLYNEIGCYRIDYLYRYDINRVIMALNLGKEINEILPERVESVPVSSYGDVRQRYFENEITSQKLERKIRRKRKLKEDEKNEGTNQN